MDGVGVDPLSDVVEICRDLIRIDTSNPGDSSGPGERLAAEYVAERLSNAGLEVNVFEAELGRTNVVARWGGGGDRSDALLIHGHLDVVPAMDSDWTHPPFAGEVADGYVWGRGAVDMKDFDAMVLAVVEERQRTGRAPDRPVVLAFTADEEAGGHRGAEPLVKAKPEWFEGVTEAIGEVGGFSTTVRGRRLYLIEAAEKGMAWMRLTARGTAGHGSMIHPDNAVTRLASAVARVGSHPWPIQLTPAVETLLAAVGELAGVEATPDNAEALVEEFGPAARMIGATLRHVSNPSMLAAGHKVNVIPSEAVAHIDGRFLPGFEDDFFDTVSRLVGDDIDIEFVSRQRGWSTPYNGTSIQRAMADALLSHDPDAVVAPYLMSAGTDAKHFGLLGINTYGFAPLRLPDDLDFTALFHGVDERVPVDALRFGAGVLDDFLDRC